MENQIHGHEVLRWMISTGREFTPDELVGAIEQRFGAQTRFVTCSASGLDAAALVAFLHSRGKFRPVGGGAAITADQSKICAG